MLPLWILLVQTPALSPGNHDLSLRFGDRTRRYTAHLPPQVREGQPLAVVLSFHGGGGTAKAQEDCVGACTPGMRAAAVAMRTTTRWMTSASSARCSTIWRDRHRSMLTVSMRRDYRTAR